MALVPHDLAPGQLVTLDGDYTVSLRPESRTVLIDATTGERVLHIADVDLRANDAARRALIIRPQVRLKDATRYIVGMRTAERRRGRADRLAGELRGAAHGRGSGGVAGALRRRDLPGPRDGRRAQGRPVLLAWDFTTRTEDQLTGDMLSVRAADHRRAARGRRRAITEVVVTENPNEHVFAPHRRRARGAAVHRDADGRGFAAARTRRSTRARRARPGRPLARDCMPRSIGENPAEPGRILQFGHGFFGQRTEITDNFVFEFAHDRFRFVVAGGGLVGHERGRLAGRDRADHQRSARESMRFVDRVHQGMANFIALSYAANTTLRALPADAARRGAGLRCGRGLLLRHQSGRHSGRDVHGAGAEGHPGRAQRRRRGLRACSCTAPDRSFRS
jgi:hypothetical protein